MKKVYECKGCYLECKVIVKTQPTECVFSNSPENWIELGDLELLRVKSEDD